LLQLAKGILRREAGMVGVEVLRGIDDARRHPPTNMGQRGYHAEPEPTAGNGWSFMEVP